MIASMRFWLQTIPEEWIIEVIEGEENTTDLQYSETKTDVPHSTEQGAPESISEELGGPTSETEDDCDALEDPLDTSDFGEYPGEMKKELVQDTDESLECTEEEMESPGDGVYQAALQDTRGLVEEAEEEINQELEKDFLEQSSITLQNRNVNDPLAVYPCQQCDKVYRAPKYLDLHVKDIHVGVRYHCDTCGYSSGRKQTLTRHKQVNHVGSSYPCGMCDYVSRRKETLKRHKLSQHGEVPVPIIHSCDECDFTFSSTLLLKKHIQFKHQALYKCSHCDYKSGCKKNLKAHVKSKHESKPIQFTCDICGKDYRRLRDLTTHKQSIHEKIRYLCNQCDTSLASKEALNKHIKRKHEQGQDCVLCNYKGTDAVSLRQHVKSKHEGIVYPCDKCNKTFTKLGDMRRHKNRMHDNSVPVHPCSLCKFVTIYPECLKKHTKRKHGK